MPFIPVPQTVQLEFVYLWQGQTCETVLGYTKPTPWSLADMGTLAAAAIIEWNTNIRPRCSNTLSLTAVKVTDLTASDAPTITVTAGLPLVGALTGDSVPNNVSLVVTKRTAKRGRSYRGRIYHPGLAANSIVSNQVGPATVGSLVSSWQALVTVNAGSDDATMVVISRANGGSPLLVGVATPVTNMTSDGTVDSQRKRLPGRGN